MRVCVVNIYNKMIIIIIIILINKVSYIVHEFNNRLLCEILFDFVVVDVIVKIK